MFKVPEESRVTAGVMASSIKDGLSGCFTLPSPSSAGWTLFIIASDGSDPRVPAANGWEHVSVQAVTNIGSETNLKARVPTWREMCFVKEQFWDDDDCVFQLHPPKSNYVNVHPCVLHLWRHRDQPCPQPPIELV